jgi:hypothetical protein
LLRQTVVVILLMWVFCVTRQVKAAGLSSPAVITVGGVAKALDGTHSRQSAFIPRHSQRLPSRVASIFN